MVAAKVFLATANLTHATILGVTTGTAALPTSMFPGLSAYIGSKFALIKFLEFLASENPNVFVASLHPGMVETETFKASGAKAEALPMDTGESHLSLTIQVVLTHAIIQFNSLLISLCG
jgi:short-subunit dehydrogenase